MKLSTTVTETITRREYNERFGQADKTPEVDIPAEGEHLWEWFWHLSERRPSGMNGPQPLSYLDIDAWVRHTGTLLLREETSILLQLDTTYLNAVSEEQEAQRKEG